MPSPLKEIARAKVNLTLRVLGRRPDGYHDLESLVVFADIGDTITFIPGAAAGVTVKGRYARAIDGENIATRALRRLAEVAPGLMLGAVEIEKRLPVAAGIGGGSADAAAVLRAVRDANPEEIAATVDWHGVAASLGADVPVCLASTAQYMWGTGSVTAHLSALPRLPAVLVNPGVPLATADVFRALAAPPLANRPDGQPRLPGNLHDATNVIAYLRASANDLEAPARALCPPVDAVLTALRSQAGAAVARMSGSGATCFAIFGSQDDADIAARRLRATAPVWWVEATTLG